MSRAVDEGLVHALHVLLFDRHAGREKAATAVQLLGELASFGLEVKHSRRIGEAVAWLIEQGVPVCSASDAGYWIATTAEEIEDALRETERRARRTLLRRRFLKRALLALRGQRSIPEVA